MRLARQHIDERFSVVKALRDVLSNLDLARFDHRWHLTPELGCGHFLLGEDETAKRELFGSEVEGVLESVTLALRDVVLRHGTAGDDTAVGVDGR